MDQRCYRDVLYPAGGSCLLVPERSVRDAVAAPLQPDPEAPPEAPPESPTERRERKIREWIAAHPGQPPPKWWRG